MPKRDRNHELETETQRAFSSAMPSSLVVRPVSDDYGVDREVEVFVGGQTTGLTFKVQLKGTDKSGTTRRVKREHLNYWLSLDVPVLLVSYEAPSQTLRGRWVHSIGADAPDSGAETLTVHMDPQIKIDGIWAERLANDLSLIRQVRRGELPNPVPVRLEVSESDSSPSVEAVASALLRASRRTERPMRAPRDTDEAAIALAIGPKRVQVALPLRLASCTMHLADGAIDDPQTLADLCLFLAAGTVVTINPEAAREWALGVDPTALWWEDIDMAERLLRALAHRDTVGLLLRIHADLIQKESPVADFYSIPLLSLIREARQDDFESYAEEVHGRASGDWHGGRLIHNLAHLYKARRDFERAADLFREASAREPRYLNDPQFLRHLGACDWELGRFDQSVVSYRDALAHGFDAHELQPLLADSLMYAGRFAEAQEALNCWEIEGDKYDRAGIIRRLILDEIVEVLDLPNQDRLANQTPENLERVRAALEQNERDRDTVIELLKSTDALNPFLWMRLIDNAALEESLASALTAALVLSVEPKAWVIALMCALSREFDESMIRAIVEQARYLCGDEFYEAVLWAADQEDDDNSAYLRRLIDAAYATDAEALGNTFRILNEPGGTEFIASHIRSDDS